MNVVAAGTASNLKIDGQGKLLPPELQFAGKTGTAQVKRITERERDMGITQASLPWHLRHHALFVCWGPVANARYACAVIIEHGQAGGATAGPIGRDVLVETMKRDPSRHSDRFKKMGLAMSVASLGLGHACGAELRREDLAHQLGPRAGADGDRGHRHRGALFGGGRPV